MDEGIIGKTVVIVCYPRYKISRYGSKRERTEACPVGAGNLIENLMKVDSELTISLATGHIEVQPEYRLKLTVWPPFEVEVDFKELEVKDISISKNDLPCPVIFSDPGELLYEELEKVSKQVAESSTLVKIHPKEKSITIQLVVNVIIVLYIIDQPFEIVSGPSYGKVKGNILEMEDTQAFPPGMGGLKANVMIAVRDSTTNQEIFGSVRPELTLKTIAWPPLRWKLKNMD